jgi:hypothetical protein
MRYAPIVFLFALAACASSPGISNGVATQTAQVMLPSGMIAKLSVIAETDPVVTPLAASPAGAWSQVPAAYADLGIPLTFSQSENMMAGNQGLNIRRQIGGVGLRNYLLCGDNGSGPNADSYLISLNIATQVQKVDDGTSKVATVLDATATSMTTGTNPVHCSSTGELEKRLNELVAKHLNLR